MTNASGAPEHAVASLVHDARPIARAIQELNGVHGWQITYEDLPYVTPLVKENGSVAPGANRTSLPVVTLMFTLLSSAGLDQASVVEGLVKDYNARGGGNVFAVVHGARLLHVVPLKARGLSGTVKPVLDTVITVAPKARTAEELLDEICKKISNGANTTVEVGMIPVNMFASTNTSIGGSGKTARSLLEQLILVSGATLSWQLFFDPEYKMYALNIHWVDLAKKQ